MKNIYWTKDEVTHLKTLFPDNNDELVANILNRPQSGVQGKAVKLGLHKSKDYLKNRYKKLGIMNGQLRALSVDHNYFANIDNQNKAYWLGFLYADGSVMNINHWKIISVRVNINDEEIIQKFKKDINSDHKISRACSSGKYSVGIKFHSTQMFDDLGQYGMIPNKTYIDQEPKNIPEQYLSHFIRGLFDGDGCITCANNCRRTSNICVCGVPKTCEWLKNILHSNLGVGGGVYKQANTTAVKIYRLSGVNMVHKFAEWIYKDSNNLFLQRKYNKFKELGLI